MLRWSVNLKGSQQVLSAIAREQSRARSTAAAVLTAVAERIVHRAQTEFIPMEFGALASSDEIDRPVQTSSAVSVTVAFGRSGKSAAYALAIHEHLSPHSPPSWKAAEAAGRPVRFSPAGTGPKYLERPFYEEADRLPEYLAAARIYT